MTAIGLVRGADHVADDAADAGVGAAERLDRRRMVVRLGLDRHGVPGENSMMPALPTNALRRNGAAMASVAARSCCRGE